MEAVREVISAWNLDSFVDIRGAVTNLEVHRVLREEADVYLFESSIWGNVRDGSHRGDVSRCSSYRL